MKLFKRSPKLHHTRNLIFANPEGNIIFSHDLPSRIIEIINIFIKDNNLYEDDRVYLAIYQEYKAHYVFYDIHPWLLYFRIPIVISAQYVGIKFIEPDPMDYLIPESNIKDYIPSKFRIPTDIKNLLLECLNQSKAYMKTIDGQDLDYFGDYLEFKFLSEWPVYWVHGSKYVNIFSNRILAQFIDFGGDNKQTIKNIIERTIKSNIEKVSTN